AGMVLPEISERSSVSLAGSCLRGRLENMIAQVVWLQCSHDRFGLGHFCRTSMSDNQVLARLQSSFIGHDTVFGYADAEQACTDGTQASNDDGVFEGGDDPGHQWTADQDGTNCGDPKERRANQ